MAGPSQRGVIDPNGTLSSSAATSAGWSAARPALAALAMALFTAACAQISVPLPGSPVPVTMQTFAVVLAGLTLGPAWGTASMVLYLMMGLVGMPVFADAAGGWTIVHGATGGYLLGFLLAPAAASVVAGRGGTVARVSNLARHEAARVGLRLLAAGLVGHAVVFASGLPWLKGVLNVTWAEALALGLWPFVPGTIFKSVMAAGGLGLVALVLGFRRRRG